MQDRGAGRCYLRELRLPFLIKQLALVTLTQLDIHMTGMHDVIFTFCLCDRMVNSIVSFQGRRLVDEINVLFLTETSSSVRTLPSELSGSMRAFANGDKKGPT